MLPDCFFEHPPSITRISLARVERPPGALPTTVKDVLEYCLNQKVKIFFIPSTSNVTECYVIRNGEDLNYRIRKKLFLIFFFFFNYNYLIRSLVADHSSITCDESHLHFFNWYYTSCSKLKERGWHPDKEYLTVKTGSLGRELSQYAKREVHESARPAFQCLRKSQPVHSATGLRVV